MLKRSELAQIEKWLEDHRIEDIECMIMDISGRGRGKSMPPGKFLSGIRSGGLRLPETVFALTITGEFVYNRFIDFTERDILLIPDASTICIAPWQDEPTASVICDAFDPNGEPLSFAPRQVLRNVLKLYSEKGWRPIVAPEFEFYLLEKTDDKARRHVPPKGDSGRRESSSAAFSIDGVDEFGPMFDDVYDYCEAQNVHIDALVHEAGPAQFEINLMHDNPLDVADQAFFFKRIIRKAALRHGHYATFMAKPYPQLYGSSMHVHQSVIDITTRENVFANEDGTDSDLFLNHIAGLQKYLPAVMPMLAPYFNSYRRLAGRMSSPVNTHWGRENRTVGLRVPDAAKANRRVENRVSGADVNPYLAIAASLACGYLGMVEGLTPSDPLTGNAYELDTYRLPIHYLEALENFRSSEPLRAVFGEPLIELFIDIKEDEHTDFLSVLSPWETDYLTHSV